MNNKKAAALLDIIRDKYSSTLTVDEMNALILAANFIREAKDEK